MMAIRMRAAVVYLATGVFFLVAAVALLQADSIPDAFMKAGVACAVVTGAGMMLVHVVAGAGTKARAPETPTSGKAAQESAAAVASQPNETAKAVRP